MFILEPLTRDGILSPVFPQGMEGIKLVFLIPVVSLTRCYASLCIHYEVLFMKNYGFAGSRISYPRVGLGWTF